MRLKQPATDNQQQILTGIELFNAHQFWHAHESWEQIWLTAQGEEKRFLQGLIQLAAAYHHVSRGTFRGAGRLFSAAQTKLAPFPAGYLGVDRDEAVTASFVHHARVVRGDGIDTSEYPKLRYNSATFST
jgi:predicted metal-dependent hydrolase